MTLSPQEIHFLDNSLPEKHYNQNIWLYYSSFEIPISQYIETLGWRFIREEHKTNVTTMILLLLFFSRTNTFYEELPGKEQLGTENPPKTKPKSLNPNTH